MRGDRGVQSRVKSTANALLTLRLSDLFWSTLAMRWPPWSNKSSRDDNETTRPWSWTDWAHYTDPRTVIPTIILTGTALLLASFHRSYLRRIPQAASIQPAFWRRRSLLGRVTSVGDGDNFRLFHTPGGRLAGWGWMPGRRVPEKREDLKDKTVCEGFVLLGDQSLSISSNLVVDSYSLGRC